MNPDIPQAIAIVSFLIAFILQICSTAMHNLSINTMNTKMKKQANEVLYAAGAFGGVSLMFASYAIFLNFKIK